jgi:ABC-type polysaccharide/polyol phosphate transport system ATPase subunit
MGSEGGEVPMTTMIQLEDLALHFPRQRGVLAGILDLLRGRTRAGKGKFTALQGMNLEVHKGEVLGVIGRNGSGKSTMLRVMAGIYRPDEGTVLVRGRTSLLAGVSVGLNQNLTGRENVHLYGSILGHTKEVMDSMMEDILSFSEIGEFFEQPLRIYSSGMKARLGIAIASAIEPEILLIDEVLGVGDPQFREKSKKRILDLVRNTGTVVLVSHSFSLMTEICDRVVLVHEGKIVTVGRPEEVIKTYYEITG